MSILASFLGLGVTATPAQVTPPVDLNVPITNPRLIAAIEKHQKVKSNATAAALFEELKASFLLAAIILEQQPPHTAPGQVLFKRGDKIGVVEARDAGDARLLALFTDHAELRRFTNNANSTLVMLTKDAFSFVLDKGYAGLIINPAGAFNMRLDAPFIRTVIGTM